MTSLFSNAPIEEHAVVGAMLLWLGPWPDEVTDLAPEDFTNPHLGRVYGIMKPARCGPVDVVDVRNRLKDAGHAYLDSELLELADRVPCTANLGVWAGRIVAAADRRRLSEGLNAAVLGGGSPEDISARVRETLSGLRERKQEGLTHISETLPGLLKDLEFEADHPEASVAVRSGIKSLDRNLRLRPKEVTIIAGRPGMGKSAMAGNIAGHCALNQVGAVALFSLEMSKASLIRRMISGKAGVDGDTLPRRAKDGQLVEAVNDLHGLNLYIDDRPGLGTEMIRNALSKLDEVRLVIVDYLQLAKLDGRLERHDLRVGAVAKELKGISKDFDCHVIGLSQLNRNVEQRNPPKPMMSDLRDSGNIEEHADNVVLLYRAAYYDPSNPPIAEAIIGKQRNGMTGTVKLVWDGRTQTFGDYLE